MKSSMFLLALTLLSLNSALAQTPGQKVCYPNGCFTNTLPRGKTLMTNEFLQSLNGMYRATMQPDGNFVLRNLALPATAAPLFQSGTGMHPGARLILSNAGNLYISNAQNAFVWQRFVADVCNASTLTLLDTGVLHADAEDATECWNSTSASDGFTMYMSQTFRFSSGQSLVNGMARFSLLNGNLAISYGGVTTWAVNTGSAGAYLTLDNGNLTLKSATGTALWSTNTNSGGNHIELNPTGELELNDASESPTWSSWENPTFGILPPGAILKPGYELFSPNRAARLSVVPNDAAGQSTVQVRVNREAQPRIILTITTTNGYAKMLNTGSFTIYNNADTAVADSNTDEKGTILYLTDTGAVTVNNFLNGNKAIFTAIVNPLRTLQPSQIVRTR